MNTFVHNLKLILIALMLSLGVFACGGGGGGGGGNTGDSSGDTTTVSGAVKLSSSVAGKPRKGLLALFAATQAPGTGTPLAGADVKLYNADRPDWLYPVARATAGLDGVYKLEKLVNANLNRNADGTAAYGDDKPIPAGNYTVIASNDITVSGGTQYVAVQEYVKNFSGDISNNDLIAYDSTVKPSIVSMFGLGKNPDGTFGGVTTQIAENAAIQVTFSMAMARISVLNAISIKNNSNTAVTGTWKVSSDLLSATFYPMSLPAGVYTVTVLGGSASSAAQNVYGQKLPATVAGSFIAIEADTTPPNAIKIKPESKTSVAITSQIQIASDEPLDINTFSISATPSIGDKPSVVYVGTRSDPSYPYVYEIIPSGFLQLNTDYAITVSGTKDLAKNEIVPFTFTFKTQANSTPPGVIATTPSSNAVDAAVNTPVRATFSSPMDPSTITAAGVYVTGPTGTVPGSLVYDTTTKTSIFMPDANFASSATYTVTVASSVKDIAGTAMTANYTWSFTTVAADTTPPSVSSTTPANNAAGVAANAAITAGFSEDMDSSSITTSTFTLKTGSSYVNGTVIYTGKTAVFTPSGNLYYDTTYTATITTGARDAAGNALATAVSWSFTTGSAPDTASPLVSSTSPADTATGVAVNGSVSATFSEAMNASSITASSFTVTTGGTYVLGMVSYNGLTATFTPSGSLAYNTLYTATITTAAKDLSGNPLSAVYSWSFTTGAAADTTPPSVTSISPVGGSSNVSVNGTITAGFSEAMDASTMNTATFLLSSASGATAGTVTYNAVTKTAAFTPSGPLAYSTAYTVIITTGVKDTAGNAMGSVYSWSFTTSAAPDTTPPSVNSTTPLNSAGSAPVNSPVSAQFSETLDAATVSASSFTLAGSGGSVSGTVTCNGSTITFTPAANLAYSTLYTATITTLVKDTAGNALTAPYAWSFTTAGPPVVVPSAPTGLSAFAGNQQVTVSWTAVAGASSYNVYWSQSPSITTATGTKQAAVSSPAVVSGLTNNTTYYAVVTAVNSAGESVASAAVSATPLDPTPPPPPAKPMYQE